jgi:hypothetical protein
MNIRGQAHVALPKYIRQLTDKYTWALKLPTLIFPPLLCLVLQRPHATVASAAVGPGCHLPRPEPAVVAVAAPGCRSPRPEPASPLPAGAAPDAPGPLRPGPTAAPGHRRTQPLAEGRPPPSSFF